MSLENLSPSKEPNVPGNEERSESLGSDLSWDEEQPDGAKSKATPERKIPVSVTGNVKSLEGSLTPESVATPEGVTTPDGVTTPGSVKSPECVEEARDAEAARGAAAVDKIEVVQGVEAGEGIEVADAGRAHKFYRAMDSIMVAKHDKPSALRRRPRDSEVVDTGMMAFCVAGGAALVLMAICTVTFVIIKMMRWSPKLSESLAVSQGNFSSAPANFVQPIARIGGEESYDITFAEASVDTADYADLYTGQNTSVETQETTSERRLSNVLSLI